MVLQLQLPVLSLYIKWYQKKAARTIVVSLKKNGLRKNVIMIKVKNHHKKHLRINHHNHLLKVVDNMNGNGFLMKPAKLLAVDK
jgi:hypothetical protein